MSLPFLARDLRKVDPDRYLLSLFAPASARPALWALFLFHHELAKTRSMVTDTRLGLIRLQWWRDEITRIYDGQGCGQIPVLSTMAPLMENGTLPRELFEAMLYAREFDLEDVAPSSWEGLLNYADFTITPLNRLALKITGESASDDEIQHISRNYGSFEVLRSVPVMLSERRCYLPEDMLKAKNLSPQKIIDFNHKAEIVEIVRELVLLITSYRKCDSVFLRKQQRLMFIYLEQLKKNNFDVFSVKFQREPAFLALRLLLS